MVKGNIGPVHFPVPDFGRFSAAAVRALSLPAFQAVG